MIELVTVERCVLYLFLFAVMRTGVGLVRGQRRDAAIWAIDVEKGTRAAARPAR